MPNQLPEREALVEALQLIDALEQRNLVKRYIKNPKAFIFERCRTYDPEADPGNRVSRLMPRRPPTEAVMDLWFSQASGNIGKSRRTVTTWSAASCAFVEWLLVDGTEGFIISDTDRKSREILERILSMWEHLDDDQDVPLKPLWKVEPFSDEIYVTGFCGKPMRSKLVALPQGPNAIRQMGASFIFIDEAGVQPWFRRLIKAAAPAARRLIMAGTFDNPAWDERVGIEELRAFNGPELAVPEKNRHIVRLARGVHTWENDKGIKTLRIHFRAYPEKDSDQWVASQLAKMGVALGSPDWRKEMEMDPDAFSGELLFPEWDENVHVGTVKPETGEGWRQVCGVDFGVTNPSAFIFGSWNGYRLRVWGSHYAADRPVAWHKDRCMDLICSKLGEKRSEDFFSRVLWLTFRDPSGPGFAIEYSQEPFPWPMMERVGEKLLNDPRNNEARVKTLLAMNGVCCKQVIYQSPCPFCGKEVALEPGLRVDSDCRELRIQMKLQRRKVAPEGLETIEKSERIEDHAYDGLKYMAAGLGFMVAAPDSPEPVKEEDDDGRPRYHTKTKTAKDALTRYYG